MLSDKKTGVAIGAPRPRGGYKRQMNLPAHGNLASKPVQRRSCGRRWWLAGTVMVAGVLGACATRAVDGDVPGTPTATTAVAAPSTSASAPNRVTVSDARGVLSAKATNQALASLARQGEGDLLARHLAVLQQQTDAHLYRGNAARLLVDGPQTYAAMQAAITGAQSHVLLESYIFDDEGVAADFANLLARKAAAGVQVALMYDSVGSLGSSNVFFDALRAGGVAVCAFNPVNPLLRPGYWGINHRDHRKILVVDDRLAFTGGINISKVYTSGSFRPRRAQPSGDPLADGWRDTQLELRGPVVPAFTQAFDEHWQSQGCTPKRRATAAPAPVKAGERTVQLLLSHPDDGRNQIYDSLLGAIGAAQRSVHLTMAYFAPGDVMAQALMDAAQRGVDVVMVLPSTSDFKLILDAGRSYYAQLLEAGVIIHERQDALLHAKTAVIDGVWSTVGSSNMDWRSFVDNSEVNVVVLGGDFGTALESLFDKDVAASKRITLEAWSQRSLWPRVRERFGRIIERLL